MSRSQKTKPAAVNAEIARLRARIAELEQGACEDSAERRRVVEESHDARRMLQLVLDTIPVRVFWKDRQSIYLGCNRLNALDAGLDSPDQIIGKNDFQLVWHEQAPGYQADDRLVIGSGEPKIAYEEEQTTPQGGRIWLRTSKVPLRDEQGEIIGVLGTYEDITAAKRTEEALRQTTEELDRFFSLALDLLCIASTEGRFLRLNPAWEDTLGYDLQKLEGRHFLDFVHPDDQPATRAAVARLAAGQTVINFLNRYRRRDGSYRWIEWRSASYQGRLIYAAARDITERLRAENAVREQSAFRQAIIDRAAEGLCVWRQIDEFPHLQLTVWNDRMTEITGYTMDEINRLGWFQAMYPDTVLRERVHERLKRVPEGDDLISEEWEITRRDGQRRAVAISTSMLPSQGPQPHVLALMHDLTDRRRAEEERRRLEAQVQHVQKLESLGVLAGGIAHDFNNLLMAILGNADLALREIPPLSPAKPYLLDIQTASQRAAELCRQMLAYAGKGRFVIEPLDLNQVVEEMTRMLEVSVSKKATLKYSLAVDLPTVEADATQLRQVIMNLITNASDAIADKIGNIFVSTGVVECDQTYLADDCVHENILPGIYVYLEVSDTGGGMTPEVKARIFDPFFTTKFTGRGLGMAAVLGIVRGHHGAIKVHTAPGEGTTVRVLFPASGRVSPSEHEYLAGTTSWQGSGTVLVVDDEDMVRTLSKQMLERLGFQVLVAENGRQALQIYTEQQAQITCVLLDLTMPLMDGEETLRELRRINSDVRVILSSGYNQQDITQRFVGQGLAGFIQKPYQLDTLQAKLRQALDE